MADEPEPFGSVYDKLNPQERDGVPDEQFLPEELKQAYSDIWNAVPRFTADAEDIDEGKAWIKMEDVLQFLVGLNSKTRKVVERKKFPPPPPGAPSPPPVDTARECSSIPYRDTRWSSNTQAVHMMSNAHHTNTTQRFISDLACNYHTDFDKQHWNARKWAAIETEVGLQSINGVLKLNLG